VLRDFEPIGDYLLEVDGEAVPGVGVYLSQIGGAHLLVTGVGVSPPLLISPRERKVETVAESAVMRREDGAIDLRADVEPVHQGELKLEGEDVTFDFTGHRGALKPRPPLLGLTDAEGVEEYSAGYSFRARRYEPSAPMLRQLEAQREPVRVRVYFGTWCPHCKQVVPNILKVAEALEGSRVRIEFYGLPRSFGNEPHAVSEDIHSVPTGIVYLDGKEVGRITGNQWKIPELAIRSVLSSSRTGG
jgi:thiol-disulfide isomerase/thioredoxin